MPQDVEIGQVRMRSPDGKPSRITVAKRDNGVVNVHLSRSAEGEMLIVLPPYAAKELGELLTKATG